MIPAVFGTKKFEVSNKKIYTPNGLSYSEELKFEETEVSGKKPTVSIKGVKLIPLTFEVKLDARFVDVGAEIDFWAKTLKSKKSQSFKLGQRTLGVFFLTKYEVKSTTIGKRGVYTGAVLSLTFTEDGAKVNKASEKKTSTASSSTAKKVSTVKNSASAKVLSVKKGSIIKPRSGVRWYLTAEGAIKKSGKSGKAYQKNMTVTYTYSKNGKIVCVNPQGLGWLKVEDVTVVNLSRGDTR